MRCGGRLRSCGGRSVRWRCCAAIHCRVTGSSEWPPWTSWRWGRMRRIRRLCAGSCSRGLTWATTACLPRGLPSSVVGCRASVRGSCTRRACLRSPGVARATRRRWRREHWSSTRSTRRCTNCLFAAWPPMATWVLHATRRRRVSSCSSGSWGVAPTRGSAAPPRTACRQRGRSVTVRLRTRSLARALPRSMRAPSSRASPACDPRARRPAPPAIRDCSR
jgi:hypothetical protein